MMDNFKTEELYIDKDGAEIFTEIYLPNEATRGKLLPAVIFAPDLGHSCKAGKDYACELAKRGYIVCCIDFCGGHESESDGDALDMSLFTMRADLETVYEALADKPFVDANNVFLLGEGLGAASSALAAVSKAGKFKGLMLLYPAFSLGQEITGRFMNFQATPDTYEIQGVTVGRAFLEAAHGLDFYQEVSGYAGPVLILHGTGDTVVSSGYSVKAVNKAYKHARLELLADAGHGFEGGYFKYAVRVIVDFLDEECDLADESGLNGDLNFKGGGFGGIGL